MLSTNVSKNKRSAAHLFITDKQLDFDSRLMYICL